MPDDAHRCECGAAIRPLLTEAGRLIELETATSPDGQYSIITTSSGLVRVHVLRGPELPALAPAHQAHACPPEPAPGPNCQFCGQPMPRKIATELEWVCHPACDFEWQAHLQQERFRARAQQFRAGKRGKRR